MTKQKEDWEIEFDENFFDFGYHESGGIEVMATGRHVCGDKCRPRVFRKLSRDNIKSFIRSLLKQERQRAHLRGFSKGYFKGALDSEYGQITSEELLKDKEEK